MNTEQSLGELLVVEDLAGGPDVDDAAAVDDYRVVRESFDDLEVLFHQQDGHAALLERLLELLVNRISE